MKSESSPRNISDRMRAVSVCPSSSASSAAISLDERVEISADVSMTNARLASSSSGPVNTASSAASRAIFGDWSVSAALVLA